MPADDPPRRVGDKTKNGQRGHALAATGLADDTQCLAASDRVGDPANRPHNTGRGKEMRLEPIDLENDAGCRSAGICDLLVG